MQVLAEVALLILNLAWWVVIISVIMKTTILIIIFKLSNYTWTCLYNRTCQIFSTFIIKASHSNFFSY